MCFLVTGNYSVAGFELTLRRKISHYIITYYLPSGMFVIVSWISFLVPADIVPGRMTLLVTVFLVLVNIFNTITTNIPKAEGKAKWNRMSLMTCVNITFMEPIQKILHWIFLFRTYCNRGMGYCMCSIRFWRTYRIRRGFAQNQIRGCSKETRIWIGCGKSLSIPWE